MNAQENGARNHHESALPYRCRRPSPTLREPINFPERKYAARRGVQTPYHPSSSIRSRFPPLPISEYFVFHVLTY